MSRQLPGRVLREQIIGGEAAGAQIAREALAFSLGSLPRLVLRPAIERRVAEVFRRALLFARKRISCITAVIIGVGGFGEGLIVVMIGVDRHLERQAHADM